MKMTITLAIDILCTPEEVFPWIAEPEKAMLWQKGVNEGEIVKEMPDKTGTTFREKMEENGKNIEMQGVITGYIRNKSISFQLESKMHKVTVSYSISGDTRSTIKLKATIHWKFLMSIIYLLIGRIIKKNILHQTELELAELKRLCEQNRDVS